MEDVKLGRQALASNQTVPVGTSSAIAIPYSSRRYALVIGGPTTNPVFLKHSAAAADNDGLRLTAGMVPLVLNVQHHGALVAGPWFAIAPAGADRISYAEASLPE